MSIPLAERALPADEPHDNPLELVERRFPDPLSDCFAEEWTAVFTTLWRQHTKAPEENRWSLAEACLTENEWAELLLWGGGVGARAPAPKTLAGGVLFLAFSAAVARTQDSGQALWITVRQQMSTAWREVCFGVSTYPLEEARQALVETCATYGLRQQFALAGTHRYWRTILLQVGIQPVVNANRLHNWLEGYSLPEHLASLIDDLDHNGSRSFRELWECLRSIFRGTANEQTIARAKSNCWFTASLEQHFAATASRNSSAGTPRLRVEDMLSGTTLFSRPLFRNDSFLLSLSSALPRPLLDALDQASTTARVVVDEYIEAIIVRADGKVQLKDGKIQLGCAQRTVEATVFQFGEVLHRETVELWRQEDDLTFFNRRTGRQVEDLNRFFPLAGCAYTVLTPADVELSPPPDAVTSECEAWRFNHYLTSLPAGLSAAVDGSTIWSLGAIATPQQVSEVGFLEIKSVSAHKVQLAYYGSPETEVRSARIAGKTRLVGAIWTRCPELMNYDDTIVTARCVDSTVLRVRLKVERSAWVACWLARRKGGWSEVEAGKPLDGAELEDTMMAISCDISRGGDWWLMLGEQPLRAAPDKIRLTRLPYLGESLSLRFGLFHQEHRPVLLASAVYATGNLSQVTKTDGLFALHLRTPSPRLSEYRVHVWERGRALPRVLKPDLVRADADGLRLSLSQDTVRVPLGWAISLERQWRGARFAIEPQAANKSQAWDGTARGWLDILEGQTEGTAARWDALAFSLRWWRFPLLMHPFRSVLAARSAEHGAGTYRAWIRRVEGQDMLCQPLRQESLTGFRDLLRGYRPSGVESADLLAGLWLCSEGRFGPRPGILYEKLEYLLDCDPLLFAHLFTKAVEHGASEQLRAVNTVSVAHSSSRVPESAPERAIEQQRVAILKDLRLTLTGLYGDGPPKESCTNTLRDHALAELKSSGGPGTLDSAYLSTALLRPAEQAFLNPLTAMEAIRTAIARSPAMRACLAHHLIQHASIGRDA